MKICELKGFIALTSILFLKHMDVTSASNCQMADNSKSKVEYLIIPMKSEYTKAVLSPTELYEINQISSNPGPMNYSPPPRVYRFRTAIIKNQPTIWRNPFTLNRQHRYVDFSKEYPRNVRIHVKPIYRRPNPLTPEVPMFVEHPPVEPASNLLNNYFPENEEQKHSGDVEIIKSMSYELPPELTTYHAHEVASSYVFEEPQIPSTNIGNSKKQNVEIIQTDHQPIVETFENSLQKNQFQEDSQNDESHISKQSSNILVADQEPNEDVKTEKIQTSAENEGDNNNQYHVKNRRPITFSTHSRTHLQEEDPFVRQNRPYYQKDDELDAIKADDECNRTSCEANNKSEEILIPLESNRGKSSEIPQISSTTKHINRAISEESYSSLDYNDHTEKEVFVTVTPTTFHAT